MNALSECDLDAVAGGDKKNKSASQTPGAWQCLDGICHRPVVHGNHMDIYETGPGGFHRVIHTERPAPRPRGGR